MNVKYTYWILIICFLSGLLLLPQTTYAGKVARAPSDFPHAYESNVYYSQLKYFESELTKNKKRISFRTYQPASRQDVVDYISIIGGVKAGGRISIQARDYSRPVNLVEALKFGFDAFRIAYIVNQSIWYKDILNTGVKNKLIPPGIAALNQPLTKAQLIALLVSIKQSTEPNGKILEANVLNATGNKQSVVPTADTALLSQNFINTTPVDTTHALPIYHVTIDTKDMDPLFADDSDERFKGQLIQDNNRVYEISIKRRGLTSRNLPKKPFTIKFEGKGNVFVESPAFTEDDYFTGSKKIILNAEYLDPSFARNNLAYRLFRHFDAKNIAPHIYYVHLYINYEYQGVYAATEFVDEHFLMRNNRKTEGGSLYKIRGEFGFKDSAYMRQYPGKFFTNVVEKEFPEDADYSEFVALVDNINKLEGEEFLQYVSDHIDMQSFIDWLILVVYTANDDGLSHNFYIFKNPETGYFEFIPWDYDLSFGRTWDTRKISIPWRIEDRAEEKNILVHKLWQFPEIRKRFYDRAAFHVSNNTIHPQRLAQLLENIMSKVRQDVRYDEQLWYGQKENLLKDLDRFDGEIPYIKTSIWRQYRTLQLME